jgi:hypothetical protein
MARPSRWPRRIEVYLTRAQDDALKACALREGQTFAELVRAAIAHEIERLNTPAAERK